MNTTLLKHKSLRCLTADDRKHLKELLGREMTPEDYDLGIDHYELALNTADTLYEIGMERSSILLALSSYLVRHGAMSYEEAASMFGDDVAQLHQLLKMLEEKSITMDNLTDDQFSDFIISFVKDIRIIIHLTAFMHDLMKLLDEKDDTPVRRQVAAACRLFYAPIAHRLGLYEIKRVLEDMAVKFEHPEQYDAIVKGLKKSRTERDQYIQDFMTPLREKIEDLGIPYEIKWRSKSINSIYAKMQRQGINLDGIYDLFALRVILDVPEKLEKAMCWAIFGLASSLYVPNMLRTKDWVGKPKASGYESLHTTVLGPDNHWVEIQVRSKRMDEVAEHGAAAHWIYKGVKGQNNNGANEALLAIRTALENHKSVDSMIKNFSEELYKGEMFIFDNADSLHKIPSDSRIVDYIIHIAPEADWVELFRGANVNGEFQPLDYPLKNGDRVELVVEM